jgi:hypothetical protein
MTKLQEKNELHAVLTSHFKVHDAENSAENLNEILQSWIYPDADSTNTNLQVADMVFSIVGVALFIRKINKEDFKEININIANFFDAFSAGSVICVLNKMLQAWTNPVPSNASEDKIEVANFIDLTNELSAFLFTLENDSQKGGAAC